MWFSVVAMLLVATYEPTQVYLCSMDYDVYINEYLLKFYSIVDVCALPSVFRSGSDIGGALGSLLSKSVSAI